MVVLDILAPILLMLGLKYSPAASASLLNNFEIVATTVIALEREKPCFGLQARISPGVTETMSGEADSARGRRL